MQLACELIQPIQPIELGCCIQTHYSVLRLIYIALEPVLCGWFPHSWLVEADLRHATACRACILLVPKWHCRHAFASYLIRLRCRHTAQTLCLLVSAGTTRCTETCTVQLLFRLSVWRELINDTQSVYNPCTGNYALSSLIWQIS